MKVLYLINIELGTNKITTYHMYQISTYNIKPIITSRMRQILNIFGTKQSQVTTDVYKPNV